jgi:hypothetical protein
MDYRLIVNQLTLRGKSFIRKKKKKKKKKSEVTRPVGKHIHWYGVAFALSYLQLILLGKQVSWEEDQKPSST